MAVTQTMGTRKRYSRSHATHGNKEKVFSSKAWERKKSLSSGIFHLLTSGVSVMLDSFL
ncbi:hypothetical protein [Desulfonema magnum]|uniref:hypothetical protein n=1 Tax=Desulfonema magnum TaxID=45655 RepID=UPI001A9A939D|nr:hypothetical protein [Desulfonema magnum]